MTFFSRIRKRQNRNLVFSSVGDRNSIDFWIRDRRKRQFDLVLYYYGDSNNAVFDADKVINRKGLKFDNFSHYLKHNDIRGYEAIWVADDDIILDTKSINELFAVFARYDLWLAQPSFSPDSRIAWDITRNNPECVLRYTNFIENGVAMFSTKIIPRLTGTFRDAGTGFGVDLIWPKLLGFPRNKIAVIDAITCRHPKGNQSSLDKVVPREQHLTQGAELLRDYCLLPKDCEPLRYKNWEMLYDDLPNEIKVFTEYDKIKK